MRLAARAMLRTFSLALFIASLFVASIAPASAARKTSRIRDGVAPSILIVSPASGAEVSGTVTVTGTAVDNLRVSKVEVWLDSGTPLLATGTTTWSRVIDLNGAAPGSHTITARATDGSKNISKATVSITVPAPAPEPSPSPTPSPTLSPEPPVSGDLTVTSNAITNPAVSGSILPVGGGALAEKDGVTAVLYASQATSQLWARFFDGDGTTSDVRLPINTLVGLGSSVFAWTGNDFYVFSSGPVTLRRYVLSGDRLPGAAELVESRTFGDTDSRQGAILVSQDGSVIVSWHQQGETGPQGHRLAHRSVSGTWTQTSLAFMPTTSSKEVLVQHPSDGSVWLFSNADAWGGIGAARFTEGTSGLALSWSDAYFIDPRLGEFNADPENPNLAAVADTASGTILLGYQSALRKRYSSTVIGSQPAIARIAANRSMSFIRFPVWVERVSNLGLSLTAAGIWLAYRAVDESSLTFRTASIARYSNGAWISTPVTTLYQGYETILYAKGLPRLATRSDDGLLRSFLVH